MANVTDEQQRKGNLGGPELFLAPIGRLSNDCMSKYYCNMCDNEYEMAPSVDYENVNELVAENLLLTERGQYKCGQCSATIAEYREFKKPNEAMDVGVAKPAAAEPVVEVAPEPAAAEPVVEVAPEPAAAEPVVEVAPEPAAAEPVVEVAPEPAAAEPVVEVAPEPAAAEPVVEVAPEPAAAEPVVEVAPEPAAAEPVVEVAPEPAAAEPVVEVAPEPAAAEPVVEVAPEPAAAEPVVEVAPEPAAAEPVVEVAPEPAAAEPVVEVAPEVTSNGMDVIRLQGLVVYNLDAQQVGTVSQICMGSNMSLLLVLDNHTAIPWSRITAVGDIILLGPKTQSQSQNDNNTIQEDVQALPPLGKCGECGNQNTPDSRFCEECGNGLSK